MSTEAEHYAETVSVRIDDLRAVLDFFESPSMFEHNAALRSGAVDRLTQAVEDSPYWQAQFDGTMEP